MVIGTINEAWTLWDRISGLFKKKEPQPESLASRFVRVFETHGIHRNQIPRFFGHGLSVADVKDDDTLLLKLSEEILNSICEMFAIRREWLDGSEKRAHPCYDFYKNPKDLIAFVDELIENNPIGQFRGVLLYPEGNRFAAQALVILQETINYLGDKPIFRFHLLNNWSLTYWKAKTYLTSCIAILWKRNIYIHGVSCSEETIKNLASGEVLLGWQGEGIWELGYKTMDPEDMTINPDKFLEKIHPEEDNFGLKSALELWLKLENQGYMDSGLGDARENFEIALKKLKVDID